MSQRFPVAVAFLIERDGQMLFLKRATSKDHAPGEWEPGSGRVEAGEYPADAVVREVREETGLEVEVLGLVDTFHFYRGPARDEAIGIVFHCRAVGGTLQLSAEHDEAQSATTTAPVPGEGPSVGEGGSAENGGPVNRAFGAAMLFATLGSGCMASASLRVTNALPGLCPHDARQPQRALELRGSGGDIHRRQRRVADEAPFVLRAEPGEAVVEKPAEPKGDVERLRLDPAEGAEQRQRAGGHALARGTIRTPDAVCHANPAEEALAVPRAGPGTTLACTIGPMAGGRRPGKGCKAECPSYVGGEEAAAGRTRGGTRDPRRATLGEGARSRRRRERR
jgi:ADP-ribose pyrophosphatase YjhB (NUDIX family)